MISLNATLANERIKKIELKGHGNGLKGKDILCAAVSGISQTALLGILYYNKNGIIWKIKDGYMSITVKDTSDDKIQAILTSMIVGLTAISKEYPGKIKIKTKAVALDSPLNPNSII